MQLAASGRPLIACALAAALLTPAYGATATTTGASNDIVTLPTGANLDNLEFGGNIDSRDASDDDVVIPRIVGGNESPAGAYPWMVRLVMKKGDKAYGCGGTLVSSDIVISAQHCVENVEAVQVFYGHNDRSKQSKVDVTSFLAGSGIKKGDWAVLKLAQPLSISTFPLVANTTQYNDGPTFRSMGWGKLKHGGDTPQVLMEVDLPFIDDSKCGYGDQEICAGDYVNGGIDTCQGDSGGPLLNMAPARPVLVGIVSWGIGCARPKEPGHYTEVSTFAKVMADTVVRLGGKPFATTGGGVTQPTPTATPTKPIPTPTVTNKPTIPGPTTTAPTTTTQPTAHPGGPFTVTQRVDTALPNFRQLATRITVPSGVQARRATVSIDLTHECSDQLRVWIVTPDGVRNNVKGSRYTRMCSSWNGNRTETYPLRSQASGVWQLGIADDFGGAAGRINSWTLALS